MNCWFTTVSICDKNRKRCLPVVTLLILIDACLVFLIQYFLKKLIQSES